MDQTWHNYISLGLVHPMLFTETIKGEGPILETVNSILTDSFFDTIELTYVKDPEVRKQLKYMLKNSGINTVVCGGAPLIINGYDLNSLDDGKRESAIEFCKELVMQSYEYEAKILLLVSGDHPGQKELEDKAFAKLVNSFHQICEFSNKQSKDYSLTITIENFPTNLPNKFFVGSTEMSVRLSQEVKKESANFGLTVDLCHMLQLDEDPICSLELAKDHIVHAHLSNTFIKDINHPLYGDEHPRFNLEGSEVNQKVAADFLKGLYNVGYFNKKLSNDLPVVSLEVKNIPGESAMLTIAQSKRFFQNTWELVRRGI